MAKERTLGVIGGSGLYELDGLTHVEHVRLETPYGAPSDEYVSGRLGDVRLVFLPRHARGHRIAPDEINFRANVHGMKQLGVEWLISVTAVGSMRGDIEPGDLVVVDQFIDRTSRRRSTFFGDGAVGHVAFADPVCPVLAERVARAGTAAILALGQSGKVHHGGVCLVIDGPQFSSRAESKLYRSWGVDVIGMTALPEAKLAREAEMCFSALALATDYDCWHETEATVSVEAVVAVMRQNVAKARELIRRVAGDLAAPRACPCPQAARGALMTDPQALSSEVRHRLELIIGRYL